MATSTLVPTSIISATGWTAATVANLETSNDVRATGGTAGLFISTEITDAPGDFGSQNSIILRVEARVVGTVERAKQLTIELRDANSNILQTFSTANLTATDVIYSSSAFARADNVAAINGYRLRATVTEGGGMPDTATVEIDRLYATLDYNVAVAVTGTMAAQEIGNGTFAGTGTVAVTGTMAAQGAGADIFAAAGGGDITLASIFAGASGRLLLDATDISTLWQDAAGTTPVTADGQPVGKWDDKSGNGFHATAAGGEEPVYRTAGGGGVEFDGVARRMSFASPLPAAASVVMGLLPPPDTAQGVLGDSVATRYIAPSQTTSQRYRGPVSSTSHIVPFADARRQVITFIGQGSTGTAGDMLAWQDGMPSSSGALQKQLIGTLDRIAFRSGPFFAATTVQTIGLRNTPLSEPERKAAQVLMAEPFWPTPGDSVFADAGGVPFTVHVQLAQPFNKVFTSGTPDSVTTTAMGNESGESFTFGTETTSKVGRIRLISLDTTTNRVAGDLLGASQESWLLGLIAGAAYDEFIVIATSIPWIADSGADNWSLAPAQRTRIADVIQDRTAGRTVIIAGGPFLAYDGGVFSEGAVPVYHAGPGNGTVTLDGGPYVETYPTSSGGSARQYATLIIATAGTEWAVTYRGKSVDGAGVVTQRLYHTWTRQIPQAPANSAPFIISATIAPSSGEVSTAFTASAHVAGYPAPTLSYQWKLDGGNVGTDSPNYTATAAGNLTVVVTATNASGSDERTSAAVVVVAAGVSGTLAATEAGADAFAGSGTVAASGVSGTLAATEAGADAFAGSGTVGSSLPAMELIFDASDAGSITLSSGQLTNWASVGSSGLSFSAAASDQYLTRTFNGATVIDVVGTADATAPNIPWTSLNPVVNLRCVSGNSFTVFVSYFLDDHDSSNNYVVSLSNVASTSDIDSVFGINERGPASGNYIRFLLRTGTSNVTSPAPTPGTLTTLFFTWDGTTALASFNGGAAVTMTVGTATSTGEPPLRLGRMTPTSASTRMDGGIALIGMAARVLSAAEHTSLRDYAIATWGP